MGIFIGTTFCKILLQRNKLTNHTHCYETSRHLTLLHIPEPAIHKLFCRYNALQQPDFQFLILSQRNSSSCGFGLRIWKAGSCSLSSCARFRTARNVISEEGFQLCSLTLVATTYRLGPQKKASSYDLKVGSLDPVACTRSGSGFLSNATLFWIFYSISRNIHIFII
jgi:hypothetical protein